VENATTLASASEDTEGLVRNVALLEGELVEACRAQEAVEEEFYSLSNVSAAGLRRLVVSEKDHREQFEEPSLMWAQDSELCLAIIGRPRVRNYLSEGMWAAALHHTEVVRELAALQAVVSSAVEFA
jgi:hypothetical protein